MDALITAAADVDAEAILRLQYLCYRSEAEIYGDFSIPPLTQTVESLRREMGSQKVLIARLEEEIIGSVRAYAMDATCYIGRLIVHPQLQRRGIGSRLMEEIEDQFPSVAKYQLFTGHRSEANLRLYHRLGYREFKRETASPNLVLVYMEKNRLNQNIE